jgi:aminoglycoside phosphotransferase (APT) family kinase protein
MTALWERDSWRGALDLAEPLAFLPEERILVQGPVAEDLTLKELARMAFAEGTPELLGALRTALAQTGRALATLHRSGAAYGRTATFEDEVAEVREVIDRLAVTVPELSGAAGALLHRLEERAADHPADPVVPAHHDFRPAQVLLHGDGLGFIDFDGASMAEPALDLGRFRAKLRDIGISSLLWTGAPIAGRPLEDNLALLDDLCELFLASYLEHAEVSRERVALWESCDLLTGMLHAWTKVRLARLEPRLAILHHQLRSSGVTT